MIFTLVLATALSSAQEHSFISAATERVRKALGTHWTQSCDSWHPGTHTALQAELESQVAGQQHIIEDIVDSVQAHLHETSQSPLVMSFHGASGTGKTFVSEKLCLAMHGLDRKAVAELENNGQRESVAKKMGCLFYRAHDLQEEEIDSIKVIKQRIHKIMKEARAGCPRVSFSAFLLSPLSCSSRTAPLKLPTCIPLPAHTGRRSL
jgi:hypothetical protein